MDSESDANRAISEKIQELGGWRGETLAWARQLIHDADPEIQENGRRAIVLTVWQPYSAVVVNHDADVVHPFDGHVFDGKELGTARPLPFVLVDMRGHPLRKVIG